MTLLDVGGGTGDIAFKFLDKGGNKVTVCDINEEMLTHGRNRAINEGHLKGLKWVNGDAEHLPIRRYQRRCLYNSILYPKRYPY